MKRFSATILLAFLATALSCESASAQYPLGIGGFQPFGFYQPYGARYSNSLSTPPYFALHPPVYYGARYARPYGISPFASPPIVTAPSGYEGRLRTNFQQTPTQCNPYLSKGIQAAPVVAKVGEIKINPFAEAPQLVAK